ncbi:ankyrin repeat-containing domain protein [Lasiosphaeria ovina]|uniref:Ankyrin repeat-containing domain protein n=1 Tax=Lasiosphaeria ovina TaxID=92902 RepID=A0AAE0JTL9_9PEZI|nr:ankyrin repeat-containing domain protein [Lasiosphaeria ovina]
MGASCPQFNRPLSTATMDGSSRTLEAFTNSPFNRATTVQLWRRLLAEHTASSNSLHEATCCGDLDTVMQILDDKTDSLNLNAIDEDGRAPIHFALRAGSSEIVQLLLEAGASPDPIPLPEPSIADALMVLSRILYAAFQWLFLIWVASKQPFFPAPFLKLARFRLVLSLGLGAILSYTFAIVWLLRKFPHFRPDSIADAATVFRGDSEHAVLMLIDSGYQPSYIEMPVLWEEAALKGYTGLCQRLMQLGWDVNAKFVYLGETVDSDPVVLTALLYASGASHSHLVSQLLSRGADPVQLDSLGRSCLLLSCMRCYPSAKPRSREESDATLAALLATDAVQHLNKNHLPPGPNRGESVFQLGWGWPLAEACRDSCTPAVQLLLDAGADPNFADELGVTALHVAAGVCYHDRNIENVKILLDHGAKVNVTTSDSWTALGKVCNSGSSPEALKVLLEAGADPSFGAGQNTPLQIAARHDISELQLVRILLEWKEGIDVNATGGQFGSALVAGLNKPKSPDSEPEVMEFVRDMISHGADVNLAPDGYHAPITTAAIHDWPSVVQLLINHGAAIPPTKEVTGKAEWPRSTLQVSILSYLDGFQAAVFDILLHHGATPNGDTFVSGLGGDVGSTILGHACSRYFADPSVARLLLSHGADANALDPRGRRPLHEAAFALNAAHARLLLQHGAAVDLPAHTSYGTPWHSLCKGLAQFSTTERNIAKAQDFHTICQLFAAQSSPSTYPPSAVWTRDAAGNTCLHYLAALSEPSRMVLALAPGGGSSTYYGAGNSPAADLVQRFLALLCRGGLHPSALLAEDAAGQTALHVAARLGDVDVMVTLLEHVYSMGRVQDAGDSGSDDNDADGVLAALLEGADNDGSTALLLAAGEGHALACRFFMDVYTGAARRPEPLVALAQAASRRAARNGHVDVARYLAGFRLVDRPNRNDIGNSVWQGTVGGDDDVPLVFTESVLGDAIAVWRTRVNVKVE